MNISGTATAVSMTKTTGYLGIGAWFAYLNIPDTQLYILSIMMIIDFCLGVLREIVLDKTKVTSHKAWLGIFKKVSTLVLVLSLGLMFKGIDLDGSDYIEGVLGIFIMAEAYSITRSVYAIRTGKMLPEYDVISIVIKKIGDSIVKLIDKK